MTEGLEIITASDVATYVVCPKAWHLKYQGLGRRHNTESETAVKELRKEWIQKQDLSAKLRSYAKIAYLLLIAVVIIVFIWEQKRTASHEPLHSVYAPTSTIAPDEETTPAKPVQKFRDTVGKTVQSVPGEIATLLLVLGLLIFMWDLFERQSKTIRKSSGLDEKAEMISLKDSSSLPSKEYRSDRLGLMSRPDALVKEEGYIIPVDIRPSAKKIRDRHVVGMMVHLRLIEEIEGDKPPYGIILVGKDARPSRIKNAEDKQRWLGTLLDEMRSIMDGIPAQALPSKFKCKNCDVRESCEDSSYRSESSRQEES